jgi:hypothetical protein
MASRLAALLFEGAAMNSMPDGIWHSNSLSNGAVLSSPVVGICIGSGSARQICCLQSAAEQRADQRVLLAVVLGAGGIGGAQAQAQAVKAGVVPSPQRGLERRTTSS